MHTEELFHAAGGRHGAESSGIRINADHKYVKYFFYIYLISFAGRAAGPADGQAARSVNYH
jgi:hypothetical protein